MVVANRVGMRRAGLLDDKSDAGGGFPFANVISVDATDPDADYADVPSAVAAASPGDIVIIGPGTYTLTSTLIISAAIHLLGLAKEETTITTSTVGVAIDATTNGIILENLTLSSSYSGGNAIMLDIGANITVRNCIIPNTGAGGAAQNKAIDITGGTTTEIVDCDISCFNGGTVNYGVQIAASTNCRIIRGSIDAGTFAISSSSSEELYLEDVQIDAQISVSAVDPQSEIFGAFPVINQAGARDPGTLGYTDENGEFVTTTTASDRVDWAVITVGVGSNNRITFIKKRGVVDLKYTGSAPSAGDYIVTSTTAGSGQGQTFMSDTVCAVCQAAGSGGLVKVLLLTGTKYVPLSSSSFVINNSGIGLMDTTAFVALINSGGLGGLTATNVPFDTVSSGNKNVFSLLNSVFVGVRLFNGTRGTYRTVTAVDLVNDVFTTVSSTDSWADGDAITVQSPTIVPGSFFYMELDLSVSSVVPILARTLYFSCIISDSGAAGKLFVAHPFTTFSSAKQQIQYTQVAAVQVAAIIKVPLIDRKLGISWQSSGTAFFTQGFLLGVDLAIP